MATREITLENLEGTVGGNDIVLIDFWAEGLDMTEVHRQVAEQQAAAESAGV